MKKKICLAILFSFVGLSVLISPSIAQNLDHDIINKIKITGPGARFVVAQIQPIKGHNWGGFQPITFAGSAISGDVSWVAGGMTAGGNNTVICFTDKIAFLEETFYLGQTKVYLPQNIKGFTFDSQADNPLTFILIERYGLVYISGRGSVTFPDGKTVKLPKEDTMSKETRDEAISDLSKALPIKKDSFYIDLKDIAPEAVATKGEYFSVFIMDRPNLKWNPREQINDIIYDCTNLYLGKELIGCLVKKDDSRPVLHPVLYKERSEIILVYSDPSQKVVFSSDELNRINETKQISNIINSLTLENDVPLTEFPGDKILISQKSLKPIIWHIGATLPLQRYIMK